MTTIPVSNNKDATIQIPPPALNDDIAKKALETAKKIPLPLVSNEPKKDAPSTEPPPYNFEATT